MGKTTGIEWTDSTINLMEGCTKVSEGCKNCYMFRLMRRFGKDPETVRYTKAGTDLFYLEKKIQESGEKIFINSMSDTFHESLEFNTLMDFYKIFRKYPNKQFQILTKRSKRLQAFYQALNENKWHYNPPYYTTAYYDYKLGEFVDEDLFYINVWCGVSVENNRNFDRIIDLQNTPGILIRFISFEPLLESISYENLEKIDRNKIKWVIVGGESDSSNPREFNPIWAKEIRDYCRSQQISFFFKQHGGKGGSGIGGNILFGNQYHEFPSYIRGDKT